MRKKISVRKIDDIGIVVYRESPNSASFHPYSVVILEKEQSTIEDRNTEIENLSVDKLMMLLRENEYDVGGGCLISY